MRTTRLPVSMTIVAALLVAALLVAACASPRNSAPSTTPAASATSSSVEPSSSSTPSPSISAPPGSPASDNLQIRGNARAVGEQVLMAPGPGGTLYVSIPTSGETVLAQLDRTGRPGPGWPRTVRDSTSCDVLLPVADGSVRIVCAMNNPDGNLVGPTGAFAFDSTGGILPGWPVTLRDHRAHGYFVARVINDDLTIHAWSTLGDVIEEGQPAGQSWLMTVGADGEVRNGVKLPYQTGCCPPDTWAIGPDGVSYGTLYYPSGSTTAPGSTEIVAVTLGGIHPTWLFVVEGAASAPAFDAAGRLHLTLATGINGPARTLVSDPDGRPVVGGANPPGLELGISASAGCVGVEGTCVVPAAPLVGEDGTTFVVGSHPSGTTAVAVSLSGKVMAGWPYRSDAGHQRTGFCVAGDSCEGYRLAAPSIGPDNILYLINAATSASLGGSLVAVRPDGGVRPGWPVELSRQGAEFWSVVVGADGTAYALAIEPEAGDVASATILAIAPDSTVRYTTTIIEP